MKQKRLTIAQQIILASQINEKGVGRVVRTLDDPALREFSGLPRVVMDVEGNVKPNGHKKLDKGSKTAENFRIRKFYNNGKVIVVEFGQERDDGAKGVDIIPHDPRLHPSTLVAWQLYGYTVSYDDPKRNAPQFVRDELSKKPCVFSLSTGSKLQFDHKFGREDQRQYPKPADVSTQDFQPATRGRNIWKKGQCQKCRNSNKRFDARRFGFSAGWTEGGEKFVGAKEGCRGCYLFDPQAFCAEISKAFKPKKG